MGIPLKTKKLRMKAHRLFDPIWKSGLKSRTKAYMWLAWKMDIPLSEAHFGAMDKDRLQLAIEILKTQKDY